MLLTPDPKPEPNSDPDWRSWLPRRYRRCRTAPALCVRALRCGATAALRPPIHRPRDYVRGGWVSISIS